ncbi:Cof-like hydrolase [Burkholderia sp. YI23]|uniref:Cof-type HAD-IIB family hydrolase n=1 Tax=unclassified Caballeronia TaxID=2646786 RepID=UPI00023890D3|nr:MULTISPECIES: Cof-type HAD-IIB family hydrolase [unclassified Caballeronia]AET87948.1 Cof-like hydrolase [Burkholderia sp. YI23]MCE4543121.1 Cof-type HAD-IIB family hydrolase [Caballeronia sp. PC1]MCE4567824.1 Cof-type HAD-IIB family hydrolase [Caballeronia sp. CLC5]
MYSVIATDLDGTLLNSDHQLDPFTAETVRTLSARGVPIVIATGRHHRDVAGIRDVLGVDAYLITSNGARVHAPGDERIYSRNLDPDAVRRLVQPELAGSERVIVNLFADDAWLIDRHAPELLVFHQDSGFKYEVMDLREHDGENIAKVLYIGDPADLKATAANLEREFGDSLYVTYSLPDCLEVMTSDVSKGRALRFVLERLDVDVAQCVAFGDNMNDIDLLETAGHPFMMNNANPDLMKRLPNVPRVGNNFEAGVAHQLRKLFGIRDELASPGQTPD